MARSSFLDKAVISSEQARRKGNTFVIKCFAVARDLISGSRYISFKGQSCLTGVLVSNHILKMKYKLNLIKYSRTDDSAFEPVEM